MLTSKGRYGLQAMIYLACLEPGETAHVADIAAANNTSKKFLDVILLDLRNAGLLFSKKGPGGGYALAKPARNIKVGMVVRVLDMPIAPIACASRTAYRPCETCPDPKACSVRKVMTQVRDAVAGVLDSTTIADLAGRTSWGAEERANPSEAA